MEDIFEIQDEISQAIVEKLKGKLIGERITKRYTDNLEAYKLCLRGRYYWHRQTSETLQKAITCYEQALAEDPGYALAHTGLAACFFVLAFYGVLPAEEAMPKMEAAALKALETDGDLAVAHASIGLVESLYHWNWGAGERAFQRAIELDSSYALAHYWYSLLLLHPLGRLDEALAEARHAAELDPFMPDINLGPAVILLTQRRYEQALDEAQKALELDPNYVWTHHVLGLVNLAKGDHDKAVAALERVNEPSFRQGSLGYAYAVAGEPDKARRLIEELKANLQTQFLVPYHLAWIYFGLGEKDTAFAWLEKAYHLRSPTLFWMKTFPGLDSVRTDLRFQDIMRRMNLAN